MLETDNQVVTKNLCHDGEGNRKPGNYDSISNVVPSDNILNIVESEKGGTWDETTGADLPNGRPTRGSVEDEQLGMGGYEEKDWAHCVASLEPHAVSAVVAGSRNSLAICGDGRLFTWGWNQRGTLGQPPETKTESSPGPVEALAGVKIVRGATSMGSAGRSLRGRKMAQGRSGGTSRSRSGALPSSKFGR